MLLWWRLAHMLPGWIQARPGRTPASAWLQQRLQQALAP